MHRTAYRTPYRCAVQLFLMRARRTMSSLQCHFSFSLAFVFWESALPRVPLYTHEFSFTSPAPPLLSQIPKSTPTPISYFTPPVSIPADFCHIPNYAAPFLGRFSIFPTNASPPPHPFRPRHFATSNASRIGRNVGASQAESEVAEGTNAAELVPAPSLPRPITQLPRVPRPVVDTVVRGFGELTPLAERVMILHGPRGGEADCPPESVILSHTPFFCHLFCLTFSPTAGCRCGGQLAFPPPCRSLHRPGGPNRPSLQTHPPPPMAGLGRRTCF